MKKKIMNGIFSALFLLALLAPLCALDLRPSGKSATENRSLAEFPQMIDQRGKISVHEVFSFESWFNDHIGFRSACSEAVAKAMLNVFHSSPSTQVHIGRSGWYYYTLDNNLQIPFGLFPLGERTLQNIAACQESIRTDLEEMGISYILVITPSKASIYPEYVCSRGLTVRETPIDTLTAYLRAHTGVNIVNTKPALLDAKANGEQVYHKTDTHWNTLGSYTGFLSIADTVEQVTGKSLAEFELTYQSSERSGDLYGLMHARGFMEPETVTECVISSPLATKAEDPALYDELKRIQNQPGSGWQGPIEIRRNDSAQGTILLFGDSFFGPDFHMSDYFAECYGETVLIRCITAYREAIRLVSPDVVIMEITERGIPLLCDRVLN